MKRHDKEYLRRTGEKLLVERLPTMKELAKRAAKILREAQAIERRTARLDEKWKQFEVEHRKWQKKMKAFEKAYAEKHKQSERNTVKTE